MTAPTPLAGATGAEFEVMVRQIRFEADGVLSFQLERQDRSVLPPWTPGAHLEIALPSGLRRQYSLCGEVEDRTTYTVATRLVPDGRGGSREMHALRAGDVVKIAGVGNNFELLEADSYLFIAGGIGITPLLPMFRQVVAQGVSARFVYLGRNHTQMAFVDELSAIAPGVQVVQTDLAGIPCARELLSDCTAVAVYACGPAPLLDDLEAEAAVGLGPDQALHIERFAPVRPAVTASDEDRKIICGRSGVTVSVQPGETYLESIRRAGIDVPSSCEMGICGTCQVMVTAGEPDHRDELLTENERRNGAFLPCVSRSLSSELTVDL
ncbi:ferredoxin-NADP reductase [Mycobacterium frederiksbergense]|uniref:Ferredoxin-NADP reductase n=1 Tax=Mycolicibacterium frederiksbergense TaxID=117567 RepID=A0ABT6KYZ9_9MYCO|nr:PDR/VanB family oxidoreductase [Mycolicibacterium frederiksbergense]MDH6195927.1 ferredoxin-NADP reductase [Mycolicibacterium frederiksbergense]